MNILEFVGFVTVTALAVGAILWASGAVTFTVKITKGPSA